MTPPRRPPPPPACPVCRKRPCEGHDFVRCSTLVDGSGVLVLDFRGDEPAEPAPERKG